MKTTQSLALLLVLHASLAVSAAGQTMPHVVIRTALGEVEIEIDTVRAPITAANFLWYVDQGFYSGGRFHRTVKPDNQPNNDVKIEVIQASIDTTKNARRRPAIALERTNVTGLHHLDGTISMARSGPDTATSDFFICINDQPSLDFGGQRNKDGQGFAAFGRVTRGMDVVRKIQAAPAEAQQLKPAIGILEARRI